MNDILEINKKRLNAIFSKKYNPLTGEGSPVPRFEYKKVLNDEVTTLYLPVTLIRNKLIQLTNGVELTYFIRKLYGKYNQSLLELFEQEFFNIRIREDFEFWAATCVHIQDKYTGQDIPFILRPPQRKILNVLEEDRMSNKPIRIILLKSRQLGGSTLIQIYGSWIQLLHKTGWNMAICAQQESQAITIRAMYDRLSLNYPEYAGSCNMVNWKRTKHKYIKERDSIIYIGSAEKPNALRSTALKLVHMSEIAFWNSTELKSPEDLAITLTSGIPIEPYTMVVMESTANGVGNYFHRQWLSSINGESVYRPIFIAWHEDDSNIISEKEMANIHLFKKDNINNLIDLYNKLDDYEKYLWEIGCCLEQIAWYRFKKSEKGGYEWRMKEEYPSTWQEAFQATGQRVFPAPYVNRMRKYIKNPLFIGDVYPGGVKYEKALEDPVLMPDSKGKLKVWIMPPDKNDNEIRMSDRFILSVDIGGRSYRSDYSVIRVIDRYWMHELDGKPEIAATWKGHIDHDLLAWKAAQLGKLYNNALIVFEINTIAGEEDIDAGTGLTIVNELARYYPNLYFRNNIENIAPDAPKKYGFFTGGATKTMIIDFLIGALRDEAYYERDAEVLDELDAYEFKGKNKYGAADGYHDDLVMATAIGIWVAYNGAPLPIVYDGKSLHQKVKRFTSEAQI